MKCIKQLIVNRLVDAFGEESILADKAIASVNTGMDLLEALEQELWSVDRAA